MKIILLLSVLFSLNFAHALSDSWNNESIATKKAQLEASILASVGHTRAEILAKTLCEANSSLSIQGHCVNEPGINGTPAATTPGGETMAIQSGANVK